MYFVGEGKFVGQKSQNNFSGKFGEIWAKILRNPKNLLSPTPAATFQACRYLCSGQQWCSPDVVQASKNKLTLSPHFSNIQLLARVSRWHRWSLCASLSNVVVRFLNSFLDPFNQLRKTQECGVSPQNIAKSFAEQFFFLNSYFDQTSTKAVLHYDSYRIKPIMVLKIYYKGGQSGAGEPHATRRHVFCGSFSWIAISEIDSKLSPHF